jgi:hypothetical protein
VLFARVEVCVETVEIVNFPQRGKTQRNLKPKVDLTVDGVWVRPKVADGVTGDEKYSKSRRVLHRTGSHFGMANSHRISGVHSLDAAHLAREDIKDVLTVHDRPLPDATAYKTGWKFTAPTARVRPIKTRGQSA